MYGAFGRVQLSVMYIYTLIHIYTYILYKCMTISLFSEAVEAVEDLMSVMIASLLTFMMTLEDVDR